MSHRDGGHLSLGRYTKLAGLPLPCQKPPDSLSPLAPHQKRVFLNYSSPKWQKKDGPTSTVNWRSPGCNKWLALEFIEVWSVQQWLLATVVKKDPEAGNSRDAEDIQQGMASSIELLRHSTAGYCYETGWNFRLPQQDKSHLSPKKNPTLV